MSTTTNPDPVQPRVLVTGANGFVGARLCRAFIDNGYSVIAGVRKSADLSSLESLKLEFRIGDITAPETLPSMVTGVDHVIHNAGLVKARTAEAFYRVNRDGTRALMQAVESHGRDCRSVVLISSLAVCGPCVDGRPLSESDTPHPATTYARSKLAAEEEALKFADRINLTILRPSGVYGPGDREMFSFFEAVNRRIRPFIGDVTRILQLIHVDDLARAAVKAVAKTPQPGSIYHIAERRGYTLAELVALLEAASGKRAFSLRLPGGVFRLVAAVSEFAFRAVGATPMLTREKAVELLGSWAVDVSRAKRELEFESEISFETGAVETFAWYRQHGWLK